MYGPQRLEPILEPEEPSEKEMVIPDVKVGEIEEEGGIQRYRVSQPVLGPYPERNEEADIVLVFRVLPIQIRINKSNAGLDVRFECWNLLDVEGVLCLAGKTELEEIPGESHLEQRADREPLGKVVIASEAKGKGCAIGRSSLKTETTPQDKPSSPFVFGQGLLGLGEWGEREDYHDNNTSTNQPFLFHKQSSLLKPLLN